MFSNRFHSGNLLLISVGFQQIKYKRIKLSAFHFPFERD